ncbi:MAG: molybdopterin-dependent oxidoreductase [Anaerolineae bacterium]|nr:molybdopterin-dependent oxidoreductase [Anaerolineae bacterium]
MLSVNRRKFLEIVAVMAAGGAISSCLPKPLTQTPGGTSSTSTATPGSQLLRNENREGFYIRYYKPMAPVDVTQWALSVTGMVRNPLALSFEDMQKLPYVSQKSRMKCVEGWSVAAQWGGFHVQSLLDLVEPEPEATWMHFYSADDYYESLSLEDLLDERVLFVYEMNGDLLLPEYGSPLRLIVPAKYAYKGPKAIMRVELADKELRGYWPTVGPYTTHGNVQPGYDYALDLGDYIEVQAGGEIFHPGGLESSGD